jgi:hypothetical protein
MAGCSGNRGGGGPAKQRRRRRKEGGGEEADQWDPVVSERKRKGKEGGGVGWRGEGMVCRWAVVPERRGGFPLFFSISFSNSFQVNLLNSNSNQIFFPNFSQNFIIF